MGGWHATASSMAGGGGLAWQGGPKGGGEGWRVKKIFSTKMRDFCNNSSQVGRIFKNYRICDKNFLWKKLIFFVFEFALKSSIFKEVQNRTFLWFFAHSCCCVICVFWCFGDFILSNFGHFWRFELTFWAEKNPPFQKIGGGKNFQ